MIARRMPLQDTTVHNLRLLSARPGNEWKDYERTTQKCFAAEASTYLLSTYMT
jgi:hypothetical protein